MKKERGSILLFSLLIMIVMLSIAMGLINVFAPKIRAVTETSNSIRAVYAADTAAEVCLYEARLQPASIATRPILTNAATFTIASLSADPIMVTNDCRPLKPGKFRFRAVGLYRGNYRAIEVSQ